MSETDIRVRTLIAEELGRPLGSVVPASRFADLGVDGEDLHYLLGEVEGELGVTFAAAHDPVRTVGDVIRLVEGELAGFARRPRR